MRWQLSNRADPEACRMADRHYSRQKIGSPQFVPPGRCLVLKVPGKALWVTSWPFPEWVKHEWAGAWMCSMFRNESELRASELIRDAVSVTRWNWPDVPELGMVTFIDRAKVRPTMTHGVPTWGRTYSLAGFREAGETKGGLLALMMTPESMPEPIRPYSSQGSLFGDDE